MYANVTHLNSHLTQETSSPYICWTLENYEEEKNILTRVNLDEGFLFSCPYTRI